MILYYNTCIIYKMPYTNVTPSKYSELSGEALIRAKTLDALNKK